jgi:hypothetical protein
MIETTASLGVEVERSTEHISVRILEHEVRASLLKT